MANEQRQQATLNSLGIPPMTPEIDAYLNEIADKIKTAEQFDKSNVRTTNFTVINFADTKQDRLWAMKINKEFIDAILITADGSHHEVMRHLV